MASFATAIEEDQYAVCARNGMETERLILQVSYTYVSGLHKYSFPGFFRGYFEIPGLFKEFPE
jgi:hypothetical protein